MKPANSSITKLFSANLKWLTVAALLTGCQSIQAKNDLLLEPGVDAKNACYPEFDITEPQYIIGYGSLMEESSKKRTSPRAGIGLPVMVNNIQRSWSIRGPFYSKTTYLGAIIKDGA